MEFVYIYVCVLERKVHGHIKDNKRGQGGAGGSRLTTRTIYIF